jgi:hypothetical protein
VASTFIPRLERRGYLRKQADTKHGTVWAVAYTEPPPDGERFDIEAGQGIGRKVAARTLDRAFISESVSPAIAK